MTEHQEELILVRLSAELSTKARGTRKRFTRRLADNIRDGARRIGISAQVDDQWMRLFVRSNSPKIAELIGQVPGISSFSRVEARVPAELEVIVRTGVRLFADRVRGRSYAVRARRTGTHPFSSKDIETELGGALNPGARVDLVHPEVEVDVEVRDGSALIFSGRTPGLGGLPLGVEGRAVCLISGGFDSAVAAWLMLKRGVELDYVFCNLAGDAYERSVVQVAKVLADRWSHGTTPRLHVIDFGPVLDDLRARTQPRFWQLILKRLMYRAAAQVAGAGEAEAIITGEAIGQVSSQTLKNLRALEGATGVPVFRPLLGFDKTEIIDISRRIGTYELSSRVKEYCSITPGNPVTHATPEATAAEEDRVDLELLRAATAERRILQLAKINSADLIETYLYTEHVPDEAVVVDVRGDTEWGAWHYPGAVHREYWQVAAELKTLDRDRCYVFYCDAGLQAAVLAEQLQRSGVEAYAFRGGTRALKKLQEVSAAR